MTYTAEVLADSPVAYWRLGESSGTTATDEMSGTSNGTYTNTPTLGAASLISNDTANTAVTFAAASSESVEVPDNATISACTGSGACTWEFWTRLVSNATGTWIGKFNNLQISHSAGTYGPIHVHDYSGGQGAHSSTGFVDTTTAHHVVVTKDGSGNWGIWIDGVDVTVTDTTENLTDNGSSVYIGRGDDSGHIDAVMDEVACYSSVLSGTRIVAHYNAAFSSGGGGPTSLEPPSLLALGSLRSLVR